ncbi:MAG TPA: hypothetical protein VGL89_18885 [Candidatus Koribacter sp.]|jgi:predicted membrane-bound spermidine synthase
MSHAAASSRALDVIQLRSSQSWLYVLFFISGFPALIYQIVWQRALFTIYGINVESVTVVVTAFMLGLGLGSLFGGRISRTALPLVPVFAIVELGTCLYGIFSLHFFHAVAHYTAGASSLRTGMFAFALIVIPTVLMGSTLPILLAYQVRIVPNTGRATGMLYFVNTLGSATACFAAGEFTMRLLGMSGSVRLAAALNALVAISAMIAWLRTRHLESQPNSAGELQPTPRAGDYLLPFPIGITLAAVSGFIALGYEIVWYRVFSWATGTSPKTFAFLLGSYLAGLALGGFVVERRCHRPLTRSSQLWFAGLMLLAGNVLGVLVSPLYGFMAIHFHEHIADPLALLSVAISAAMLGTTFPLVCELTIPPDRRAGEGLSFLYLANIIGSACGSFIAGYILTEYFTLIGVSTIFAAAGVLVGIVLMLRARTRRTPTAVLALAGTCVLAFVPPLFQNLYERLAFRRVVPPFSQVVENRHGVIAVTGDNITVLGGGVYDGRFNTNPRDDKNLISRCYSLFGFLSRPPRHVLMIGLSSGSWAQVIASNPEVQDLTIVEINPGYLRVIPRHSDVASVLTNPKVHIVIDDGHRWLLRNPTARFDLIIMNMTFHWRANATNLLSREFLELVRLHLEPGGAHFYNTTSSLEAFATAVAVFPHAVRIGNFIAVSDQPLVFQPDRWRQRMANYFIDGHPVLDPAVQADDRFVNSIAATAEFVARNPNDPRALFFEDESNLRRRLQGRTVVTDDNMAVEWRNADVERF